MISLTLSSPPTLPPRSHLSMPALSLVVIGWVASTSTPSLGGGGACEGSATCEGGRGCEGAVLGRETLGLERGGEFCTGTSLSAKGSIILILNNVQHAAVDCHLEFCIICTVGLISVQQCSTSLKVLKEVLFGRNG